MFNTKILCLGNNSDDTDTRVSILATQDETINHGLIENDLFVPINVGYYHTSIADISSGGIVRLSVHFDTVIMLDQPYEEWSHWKILTSTIKLMDHLREQGINVIYENNVNVTQSKSILNLLDNGSFCIYPWILHTMAHTMEGKKVSLCARSSSIIATEDKLGDWRTDKTYTKIRESMLKGEKLPKLCMACYEQEEKGIESYREFETKEWISKLNLHDIQDLNSIKHPYYYELRLNNKCNIACRGCRPSHSSRIEKEYKKFDIQYPYNESWEYSEIGIIDINTLTPKSRVYLTGGEPTVMNEVYAFMEECIKKGKTDFDFTIGTNATKIRERFFELSKHFTNMNFSVSIDGHGKINDYWRWGSNWDSVILNTKRLESLGHTISINCVPGIYNVTNLHLLLEFLDETFPKAGLYLQINFNELHSAFNHPNADLVVESMKRCRNTKMYYTDGKSVKTCIDSLLEHYKNNPDCNIKNLKKFFEYNDKQDQARNIRLIDYIPELEECRKYI